MIDKPDSMVNHYHFDHLYLKPMVVMVGHCDWKRSRTVRDEQRPEKKQGKPLKVQRHAER